MPSKRIRSLRNTFRKHRAKRLKSLLSITPQEPPTRSTGMMRTRSSMFSTEKLRCKFAEARFAGLVPGRYFTNHLKTFIPYALTRVRRNQRSSSSFLSKLKEHRFSLPFTSFGREHCISPMKPLCLRQYYLRGGTYEFENRATHRELDRDCPSV